MIPVAILAGGLATRLKSVAPNLPKSLVAVAGKPFIAHQLEKLRREGVARVVLCVGHRGEQIRDFVGDGGSFGLAVAYSFDGEMLLGTGGALRRALDLLGDEFFVLYGDSYLDISYGAVLAAYRASAAPALMTVFRNEGRWDTSNVVFADGRVLRHDKRAPTPEMHYIDYGLGILSREVLAARAAGKAFDLSSVYGELAEAGRLAGFEADRRFYEIGTPSGLGEADIFLTKAP